jgi:protein-tyrosine phosphatase
VESPENPTRLLPLAGGRNFRDLGGYATQDGRRVRWRRLFRSGTLGLLTAADHKLLTALGIRTVCDLRTTSERNCEPSAWIPADGRVLSWDYELDGGAVMGAFRVGTPGPERVRAAVSEFYRQAPEDFADRFGAILRLMSAEACPLVIHCTAGKDRTGVTAALLLRALGVARQTVVEDYVLSDQLIDLETLSLGGNFGRSGSWSFLSALPPETRAPLIASEPAYIEAMLDVLARQYGSVDGYLTSRLGLSTADLKRMRDAYLDV